MSEELRWYLGKRSKTARGTRCLVSVKGEDLIPHGVSSADFDWGYRGDGSIALAMALLADYFKHKLDRDNVDTVVLRYCRQFEQDVIARLGRWQWDFSTMFIEEYLEGLEGRDNA